MMRRILVPLDGSSFGEHALVRAIALARRHHAALDLVHVHEAASLIYLEGVPLIDAGVEMEGLQNDRSYLERTLARVRGLGVAASATLLDGPTVSSLDRRADEIHADLVVMATHGRGALSRAWLGSVAEGLGRHTARPLLLVRPPAREDAADDADVVAEAQPFRRVLLPVDDIAHARAILDLALVIADPAASLVVMHAMASEPIQSGVGEAVRRSLEPLTEELRQRGRATDLQVIGGGDVATCILEAAERERADLIALTTHGHGALSRLLLGSVTDKVLRGAAIPLLMRKPAA